jgi:hypothetical protein
MAAATDLRQVQDRVNTVAERIQPLLLPHPGLARRNAHAHVWLGVKVRFGQEWRERACLDSVMQFLDWMQTHPNADYGDYAGPVRHRSMEERGLLFETGE